jgi:predicted RND superfamily exporter protein
MVSSMLTAIVTVVGVATVIHLIVRFREERDAGRAPREALLRAGALLAAPIFWACATDAVGFGSLQVASVGPIQDFGAMMAVGSMLVILSVALLVPGLALWGRIDADPKRAWGEGRLEAGLGRTLAAVERRPKLIAAVVFLVAAGAAAGSYRLRVETDFTANFRASSPIARSYRYVETHLGGAGVWDVMLPSPAPKDLDWRYLSRVAKLEARLRREVPGLTKVISLADAVKAAAPRDPDQISLAFLRTSLVLAAKARMQSKMPVFYAALLGEDPREPGQHYLRIMLRARERQPSEQKRAMIEAVRRISREEFPAARVTGYFVLLTNLIDSMVRDQWRTFGVAMLGIAAMMVVALRSLVWTVIAMAPNVLPVVVVMGAMGWLGLKINMGAAMIAAVSLGLSIDSSIHYLSSFRRARAEGLSVSAALHRVQQSVGRALFFATLALIVGFSALAQSQFVPTIYFGVLVSLTMLGGLAGNLVVLPLLLTLTERE